MHNRCVVSTSETWSKLPFEDDPFAQAFIDAHPEGATIEDIAAAMGTCESRVYAVMQSGLRKLRHNCLVFADAFHEAPDRIGPCDACGVVARLIHLPNGNEPAWHACDACVVEDAVVGR